MRVNNNRTLLNIPVEIKNFLEKLVQKIKKLITPTFFNSSEKSETVPPIAPKRVSANPASAKTSKKTTKAHQQNLQQSNTKKEKPVEKKPPARPQQQPTWKSKTTVEKPTTPIATTKQIQVLEAQIDIVFRQFHMKTKETELDRIFDTYFKRDLLIPISKLDQINKGNLINTICRKIDCEQTKTRNYFNKKLNIESSNTTLSNPAQESAARKATLQKAVKSPVESVKAILTSESQKSSNSAPAGQEITKPQQTQSPEPLVQPNRQKNHKTKAELIAHMKKIGGQRHGS